MIYIIKKKGLYQNKVNFSLVSSCNFKMGYYAFWVKAKQTNLTIYIILTLMRRKSSIIPSTDDTTHFHANEECPIFRKMSQTLKIIFSQFSLLTMSWNISWLILNLKMFHLENGVSKVRQSGC